MMRPACGPNRPADVQLPGRLIRTIMPALRDRPSSSNREPPAIAGRASRTKSLAKHATVVGRDVPRQPAGQKPFDAPRLFNGLDGFTGNFSSLT